MEVITNYIGKLEGLIQITKDFENIERALRHVDIIGVKRINTTPPYYNIIHKDASIYCKVEGNVVELIDKSSQEFSRLTEKP